MLKKQVLSAIVTFSLLFTNPMLSSAKESKYVYRYAKTTVNIRSKPTTKSKTVGQVHWNNRIKVIKRVNKKWYQISYKGKKRYACLKFFRKQKEKYRVYGSPSSNSFKSCLPADCITDSMSLAQGRLKRKYKLDYKTGVYKIGDRYCAAMGSYYTNYRLGTKIDLVLSHKGRKHVLKIVITDQKADKDTVNNHKVHTDGSVVEFVVSSSVMPRKARYVMGDVSYAGKQFKGSIVKIKVYQKG